MHGRRYCTPILELKRTSETYVRNPGISLASKGKGRTSEIHFVATTLRDGRQSLWAPGMRTAPLGVQPTDV